MSSLKVRITNISGRLPPHSSNRRALATCWLHPEIEGQMNAWGKIRIILQQFTMMGMFRVDTWPHSRGFPRSLLNLNIGVSIRRTYILGCICSTTRIVMFLFFVNQNYQPTPASFYPPQLWTSEYACPDPPYMCFVAAELLWYSYAPTTARICQMLLLCCSALLLVVLFLAAISVHAAHR